MYAVSAHVERTVDGWTSSRQVPTFYLHPNVQGILTEERAQVIARRMLEGLAGPDSIIHVTAVETQV
jgi:pheromone shutdown protein TraB